MTKLLTIGLLLLSCGVVEAADFDFTLPKWYESPSPAFKLVMCSEDVTRCWTPCENKMKEVMHLAEKYKGDLWNEFPMIGYAYSGYYPKTERCVTSTCLQKELDEAKAKEKKEEEREKALEKWRAVYKECVQ